MTKQEQYLRTATVWLVAPLKIAWEDLRTRVGLVTVVGYLLVATVAVHIVPEPTTLTGEQLLTPLESLEYPLGTDRQGRGLLRMMVHATPAMLQMLFAGAIFTTVAATIVGTVSGYHGGGTVDRVVMLFNDVILALPGLPLLIVLGVIFQPQNPIVVGVLLSINAWAGLARALRSEVLSIRGDEYLEATQVVGAGTGTIILHDLLPNLMPYILVNFVQAGRRVIFSSVALYFIGVLPFNQLNWGVVLNQAYGGGALYGLDTWHWLAIPLVTIILLLLGLLLLSQGMERLFNPRIRARHINSEEEELAEAR